MKIDLTKVMMIRFPISHINEFSLDWVKNTPDTKLFVPEYDDVCLIFSGEPYNHERLAEAYVKVKPNYEKYFKTFVEQTGNTSYKDFLIYKYGACAIFDRKKPGLTGYVMCDCPDTGPLKNVIGAYLYDNYQFIEVEPFSQAKIK